MYILVGGYIFAAGFLFACGEVTRLKYYFAWAVANVALICSGLGLSSVSEDSQTAEYDNAKNFNFFGVELAPSDKEVP